MSELSVEQRKLMRECIHTQVNRNGAEEFKFEVCFRAGVTSCEKAKREGQGFGGEGSAPLRPTATADVVPESGPSDELRARERRAKRLRAGQLWRYVAAPDRGDPLRRVVAYDPVRDSVLIEKVDEHGALLARRKISVSGEYFTHSYLPVDGEMDIRAVLHGRYAEQVGRAVDAEQQIEAMKPRMIAAENLATKRLEEYARIDADLTKQMQRAIKADNALNDMRTRAEAAEQREKGLRAALTQARDAIEHARDQEVSGRHNWCDDQPIITALELARPLLTEEGQDQVCKACGHSIHMHGPMGCVERMVGLDCACELVLDPQLIRLREGLADPHTVGRTDGRTAWRAPENGAAAIAVSRVRLTGKPFITPPTE